MPTNMNLNNHCFHVFIQHSFQTWSSKMQIQFYHPFQNRQDRFQIQLSSKHKQSLVTVRYLRSKHEIQNSLQLFLEPFLQELRLKVKAQVSRQDNNSCFFFKLQTDLSEAMTPFIKEYQVARIIMMSDNVAMYNKLMISNWV